MCRSFYFFAQSPPVVSHLKEKAKGLTGHPRSYDTPSSLWPHLLILPFANLAPLLVLLLGPERARRAPALGPEHQAWSLECSSLGCAHGSGAAFSARPSLSSKMSLSIFSLTSLLQLFSWCWTLYHLYSLFILFIV